jgi:hypothetical protein
MRVLGAIDMAEGKTIRDRIPIPFLRLATPHFSWPRECMVFSFQRMMDAPIFWWLLISSWAYRQFAWIPFALNGHF